MKIITWNCNGAFRKKFELLNRFNPDVLVIQECEDPDKSGDISYKHWAENYLWTGANKNRGLGVFCRKNIQLEKLDWTDNGLQLFLPCRIKSTFNLIAVWTKHANSPNFGYIGQFWKYLQIHKSNLSQNSVICGDFNSNKKWDEWDRWWNHSDVVNELNEINVGSIYHELFNEEQGQESKPTLFMHRKLEKTYHIDYAFASRTLFDKGGEDIVIGDPKDWLEHSDHMPMIFTIKA